MIDLHRAAFFFDFDGTLAEIAVRPDDVQVTETTKSLLDRLARASGGALAIITGREIGSIDAFLFPLRLPVAGVHGLVRRDGNGGMHHAPTDREGLDAVEATLTGFSSTMPGVILERKNGAIALHYRQRPDAAVRARDAVEAAISNRNGFQIVPGKMVLEIKTTGTSKGTAVQAFMAETPFSGRTPFFAGDDVTDEDAFAAVNALGGITVKIGAGQSLARERMENPAALAAWLETLLAEKGARS